MSQREGLPQEGREQGFSGGWEDRSMPPTRKIGYPQESLISPERPSREVNLWQQIAGSQRETTTSEIVDKSQGKRKVGLLRWVTQFLSRLTNP